MTHSISSHPVTLWTGPSRATRMMQAKALAKRCAHGVLSHPDAKVVMLLGVHADPWIRLRELLSRIPNHWPTDGWILYMELRCPHCGETRLVEIQQSHKGQILVCSMCGKEGPAVTPATGNPG